MMKLKPTQKQIDFLDWEFGVFFHFGIRAFFPGHVDWDNKPMPASAFNPTHLDCKQWCRTAKNAGARYAILTCKHHDGFANWPTKYSDYSVAQSPWEGGKGDVVAEFVKACRTYKLKVGLYYSPAQWGGATKFAEGKEYDDYFINQISELLTNYGQIDYLWFDGCGSEGHEYDRDRIIKVIRDLQPGIRIFSMWDPETRWVGNEDGFADMPNRNSVLTAAFSERLQEGQWLDHPRYLPAECDMKMRTAWFDCEANEDTVKSLEELIANYDYSVGRGANLLLNIGPDCRGLLPEKDAARLLELGAEIRRRYGTPLAFSEPVEAGENVWRIESTPDGAGWNPNAVGVETVDTVIIEEDITEGEAVEEFRIMANLPCYASREICLYIGRTIGHKHICHFPLIPTGRISLVVDKAEGKPIIKSMKAYKAL